MPTARTTTCGRSCATTARSCRSSDATAARPVTSTGCTISPWTRRVISTRPRSTPASAPRSSCSRVSVPRSSHDGHHRQRPPPPGRSRARRAPALRAPERARPQRPALRLRSRPVRGVHGARRRRRRSRMRHARLVRRRQRGDDARRAGGARAAPSRPTGIRGRAGRPVRLLRERHDHDHGGAPEEDREADRGPNPHGAGGQPLPLRDARAHSARRATGGAGMRTPTLSRRRLLQGTGALVVTFSLPVILRAQSPAPSRARDQLETWLAIGQDGRVTLSTGKVELGTGVETALSQIVAEELDVAVARVTVVQGDTALTPDQGPTVGSKTIQLGGPPIREAAAEARQTLLTLAAARLGVSVDKLAVADGVVSGGARRVTYAELVGGQRWSRAITKSAPPKRVAEYSVVGRPIARVDIPAKVAGSYVYVQNVRVPGMLHGRVVRTRAVGATVDSVDEDSVRAVPGLVKVVQRGNFVGVVAEREEQAVRAARELKVAWRSSDSLPDPAALYDVIRRTSASEKVLTSLGDVQAGLAGAATSLSASYQTPWQMHASIGPSCAVADVRPGAATVWSGTH